LIIKTAEVSEYLQAKKVSDDYKSDPNAFLFSFINQHNSKIIMKCTDPSHAIFASNQYGPTFGGYGYNSTFYDTASFHNVESNSHDENDSVIDPLKRWIANCIMYPYVANVARKYLAIPATSAPSERVWSRLARILSLRRASLCDDLVGRMMYVKENLVFLHQHYRQLRKKEIAKEFQHLVDLEFKFLIPLEEEAFIDVGKNDHLVEF
jgi:hypothetical protein